MKQNGLKDTRICKLLPKFIFGVLPTLLGAALIKAGSGLYGPSSDAFSDERPKYGMINADAACQEGASDKCYTLEDSKQRNATNIAIPGGQDGPVKSSFASQRCTWIGYPPLSTILELDNEHGQDFASHSGSITNYSDIIKPLMDLLWRRPTNPFQDVSQLLQNIWSVVNNNIQQSSLLSPIIIHQAMDTGVMSYADKGGDWKEFSSTESKNIQLDQPITETALFKYITESWSVAMSEFGDQGLDRCFVTFVTKGRIFTSNGKDFNFQDTNHVVGNASLSNIQNVQHVFLVRCSRTNSPMVSELEVDSEQSEK